MGQAAVFVFPDFSWSLRVGLLEGQMSCSQNVQHEDWPWMTLFPKQMHQNFMLYSCSIHTMQSHPIKTPCTPKVKTFDAGTETGWWRCTWDCSTSTSKNEKNRKQLRKNKNHNSIHIIHICTHKNRKNTSDQHRKNKKQKRNKERIARPTRSTTRKKQEPPAKTPALPTQKLQARNHKND